MDVLITGVTRTGNLGGTAMLCAVEDTLRPLVKDIALASILPKADLAQNGPDTTTIVNADYRKLILFAFPVCLLLWPIRKLKIVRRLLSKLPLIRHYASATRIVDISGISFVDGRGLALLVYNIALILPALFFNIPVYKLSQAVGPFKSRINRLAAKWVLKQCKLVTARGDLSYSNLKSLDLRNIDIRNDTSFALVIDHSTRKLAKRYLSEVGLAKQTGSPIILISPSRVVQKYCASHDIDLLAEFGKLISQLSLVGMRVGLLPHATDTGITKNNDVSLALELRRNMKQQGIELALLNAQGDPRFARALIAEADVFIACRFHSLIAALSQGVPVVTLGWSHKYLEAATPFGMDRFTLDFSQARDDRIRDLVDQLLSARDMYSDMMKAVAHNASHNAREGIEAVSNSKGLK